PVPVDLTAELEQRTAERDAAYGEWKRQTYLGRAGRWMEPAFRPLGWDWKGGMAALAGFPARGVVGGPLGVIYDRGDVDSGEVKDADNPGETPLGQAVREAWSADPVMGPYRRAVAASLIVFFALCCQCASTLAVIRRETRSWAWPAFTFAYMTALAYLGALVTYQVGRGITDLGGGDSAVGCVEEALRRNAPAPQRASPWGEVPRVRFAEPQRTLHRARRWIGNC